MSFSMKPVVPQVSEGNSVTNEQWGEWNEYLHSLIEAPEEPVTGKKGKSAKTKTLVGILNFIMDVGYQPQPAGQYDSKCALPQEGEIYSQEELAHRAKYPTNDFIWVTDSNGTRKRKQTSPKRPEQEYVFFFDFPEVVVDYSKHPDTNMHKLGQRPLRVSYNGRYGSVGSLVFNRTLPFTIDYKTNTLSTKNPIYKIADKMGVARDFETSGYDLGVMAGKACKWSVSSEKTVKDDNTYFNFTIKDPSKIEEVKAGNIVVTVEQQIPECNVPFVGIHFNSDSYDEEAIEYIKNRREVIEVVQRAVSFKPSPEKHPDFVIGVDFKDSGLAKALGDLSTFNKAQSEVVQQQEQPSAQVSNAVVESQESKGFDDFDSQIPF